MVKNFDICTPISNFQINKLSDTLIIRLATVLYYRPMLSQFSAITPPILFFCGTHPFADIENRMSKTHILKALKTHDD
jgi:hypothetical protein